MSSPTSSSTRAVYTLHGSKTVDKSDQRPFGPPVPGAPVSRQTFPTPQTTWSIDDSVVPINRGELIRRVTRYSSIPYARSFHHPTRTLPNSATNSRSPTWRNPRRGCIERIQLELSTISVMTAEAVQRDLRRAVEEGDAFGEKLGVFSLKTSSSMSSFPGNCTEFVQVFSSAGPLRRNSISRSLLRAEPVSSGYSRCKTADPYLLPRGVNDCFDVTLVGRSLPPQRDHRRVTSLESSSLCLTRDASHPHKELSQHHPLSKIGEIDFDHVDILYIPYNGRVFCRACHVIQQKMRNFDTVQVADFPNNASWDDLRNHYLIVHPKESQEIATLTVPQVIELRERLQAC